MKILVTGAGGYLGGRVVQVARARGHEVLCVRRRAQDGANDAAPGREGGPVKGAGDILADLVEGLPDAAFAGVDAVVHCAARMTGSRSAMARDTVAATARLSRQAARLQVPMVLAGSMAVYDGMAGPVVSETTPLERRPELRDGYTRAKLLQEEVARASGCDLRIMRIGALWGRGVVWNAHLGQGTGPVFWRLGQGEIPLAHVDHAALALVIGAEVAWHGLDIINVVDDERPDAATYLAALPERPARVVPLPFRVVDTVSRVLEPFAGRLPGLLRRPTLHARMAPRRYDNRRLHALGWRARFRFPEGLSRHV